MQTQTETEPQTERLLEPRILAPAEMLESADLSQFPAIKSAEPITADELERG